MNNAAIILTDLDAARSGVAAQGLLLARKWPGGSTGACYLSPAPLGEAPRGGANAAANELRRDARMLRQRLEQGGHDIVLLHYVGFAYDRNA